MSRGGLEGEERAVERAEALAGEINACVDAVAPVQRGSRGGIHLILGSYTFNHLYHCVLNSTITILSVSS